MKIANTLWQVLTGDIFVLDGLKKIGLQEALTCADGLIVPSTLKTYSAQRQRLWHKGERSVKGETQGCRGLGASPYSPRIKSPTVSIRLLWTSPNQIMNAARPGPSSSLTVTHIPRFAPGSGLNGATRDQGMATT